MPFVQNDGARIHYHVEGQGPPLVMVHGFSDSIEDWYEVGYVDALKDDFTLVMPDARGHGQSEKHHAPEAYSMSLRVSDVTVVMDELGIDKAHYWGYSMGGRIGFGVTEYVPERIDRMILAGISHHATDPTRFQSRIAFLSHGMQTYLDGFEARFGRMEPPSKRQRFLDNDYLALIATSIDLRENYQGHDHQVAMMKMPCLVLDGTEDAFHRGARELAEMLPDGRFVSLPGKDHGTTFTHSQDVIPHVREFLSP